MAWHDTIEPIRDPPLTQPRQHGAIRDEPTCIQFPSPGSIVSGALFSACSLAQLVDSVQAETGQSPSRSLSYSVPHEATTQSRYHKNCYGARPSPRWQSLNNFARVLPNNMPPGTAGCPSMWFSHWLPPCSRSSFARYPWI
ncbi:hypothetical protein GGI42DRAFT_332475 [Trichoderma sp. SZMC 28013]